MTRSPFHVEPQLKLVTQKNCQLLGFFQPDKAYKYFPHLKWRQLWHKTSNQTKICAHYSSHETCFTLLRFVSPTFADASFSFTSRNCLSIDTGNRGKMQREGKRDDEGDDEDELNSIRESEAVNQLPGQRTSPASHRQSEYQWCSYKKIKHGM